MVRPGRDEFGAGGDEHQHVSVLRALDYGSQQFEASRVNPVHVLEQHHHRLPSR